MKMNDCITKKQHYIPQVYLRGFSPEYKKNSNELSNSKYEIFCYDINNLQQLSKHIPIKSICYIENLYEVTGKDGNVVLVNYLEHIFSIIERKFARYRKKLESKAFSEENFKTHCFLTSEEKDFWSFFIVIQILRCPQVLKTAEELYIEMFGNNVTEEQAKNVARLICLPFFKELKNDSEEALLIGTFFDLMRKKSFAIGVDKEKRIVTSDMPVYCNDFKEVVFPISSELCLFLCDNKNGKRKNILFPIGDVERYNIIKWMSVASQKLFSNHILNENEQRCIEEIKQIKKAGDKIG